MTIKKTIKQATAKIEEIYQDYEAQMKELEKEQNEVLEEFRGSLEQKKIEEIRKSINN